MKWILLLFFTYCSSSELIHLKEIDSLKSEFKFKEGNFIVYNFFPKKRTKKPIVIIYDPIYVQKESLFGAENLVPQKLEFIEKRILIKNFKENSNSSLVQSFLEAGYTVALIFTKEDITLNKAGIGILSTLYEIQKVKKEEEFILGGVSLGGQAVAHALNQYKDNSEIKIKGIFFIGTGLDYNYTNSLREKMSSKKLKQVICNPLEQENLCNKTLTSMYKTNDGVISYPKIIPQIEMEPLKNFSKLSTTDIPIFIAYGKLDGVSPEESALTLFYPERVPKKKKLEVLEASTANYFDEDYDHFDLFYGRKAKKEIYLPIIEWLEKTN
ncbi:MAG: hypothetical protein SFU98_06575 [Leptospiraceae bacterium]|nr:hypothetical protein [Leptospiraceae bacterium]